MRKDKSAKLLEWLREGKELSMTAASSDRAFKYSGYFCTDFFHHYGIY